MLTFHASRGDATVYPHLLASKVHPGINSIILFLCPLYIPPYTFYHISVRLVVCTLCFPYFWPLLQTVYSALSSEDKKRGGNQGASSTLICRRDATLPPQESRRLILWQRCFSLFKTIFCRISQAVRPDVLILFLFRHEGQHEPAA